MESYYEFNEKTTSWEVLDFSQPEMEVIETELTEEEAARFRACLDALYAA